MNYLSYGEEKDTSGKAALVIRCFLDRSKFKFWRVSARGFTWQAVELLSD